MNDLPEIRTVPERGYPHDMARYSTRYDHITCRCNREFHGPTALADYGSHLVELGGELPPMSALERICGPADKWPGRCWEIAYCLVEAGAIPGALAYGHWTGPVVLTPEMVRDRPTADATLAATAFTAHRAILGFVNHGWIIREDGTIVDPTRWVFEGRDPYIYVGPADHYDEGGDAFREATNPDAPEPSGPWVKLHFASHPTAILVWSLYPGARQVASFGPVVGVKDYIVELGTNQVSHLANLPYTLLERYGVWGLYDALDAADERAAVPIDNWRRAYREHGPWANPDHTVGPWVRVSRDRGVVGGKCDFCARRLKPHAQHYMIENMTVVTALSAPDVPEPTEVTTPGPWTLCDRCVAECGIERTGKLTLDAVRPLYQRLLPRVLRQTGITASQSQRVTESMRLEVSP